MPNQHTKQPPRSGPIRLRIRKDERAEAEKEAAANTMTLSDVIRERCGWSREDGRPNRPWSNGAKP